MHTSARVQAMRSAHIPMPANRLRLTGIKADSLGQSMDLMDATTAYSRNSEIFGEGEPVDYLYKVGLAAASCGIRQLFAAAVGLLTFVLGFAYGNLLDEAYGFHLKDWQTLTST